MSTVRGCDIPEHLYYHIEHNVWVRPEQDATYTLGMTAYACSLAGEIVSITVKKAGKQVKADRSCATVESGKWVGPVKIPAAGEIVEVNQAVVDNPGLLNEDPYGHWIVRVRPENWAGESASLLTGESAINAMEMRMEADGFGGC
jgi:glycine cleavage system H protein